MSNQQTIHEEKYASIAYLLWGLGFVGICGLHRMYLGQYQLGIGMLLTFGVCGVGQLADVAVINQAVQEANLKYVHQSPKSVKPSKQTTDVLSKAKAQIISDEVDEFDMEQASFEETMKKLRK